MIAVASLTRCHHYIISKISDCNELTMQFFNRKQSAHRRRKIGVGMQSELLSNSDFLSMTTNSEKRKPYNNVSIWFARIHSISNINS